MKEIRSRRARSPSSTRKCLSPGTPKASLTPCAARASARMRPPWRVLRSDFMRSFSPNAPLGKCRRLHMQRQRLFQAAGKEAVDYSIRVMDDINTLRRILKDTRVIAVVGLSADWYRPSYFAAKYMQEHGYRIIPVNPRYESVLGEKCYKSLRDIPERVDMVDVFRKAQDVPPIAEDAIAIGAKVLWQQLGVRNEAAAERARAAGLEAVLDRCVKIEHGRLFGGLNWVGVNTKVISAKRPRWLAY